MANSESLRFPGNPSSHRNNWWSSWESYVSKFRSAIRANLPESELHTLLTDCLTLYSAYLNASTIEEALSIISGYRCSPLEIAFMWMGRWRPTSAVVLVYSTMGLDIQEVGKQTQALNRGVPESSSLSEKQLSGLSALQKHTHQAESDLSQQLATLQMLLVEQSTLTALELGEANTDCCDLSNFKQLVDVKVSQLLTLLNKADNLRLHTLRVLLDLLTPVQAASCSLAAYEIMFALKSLSKTIQTSGASPFVK